MTAPINFYADPASLSSLKSAGEQDPKALREAARQFESLFTQMMLKAMRDAGKALAPNDDALAGEQTDFYREMFDNQIALQLSKGKGLGLADVLVRQLQGLGVSGPKPNTVEAGNAGHESGIRDSGLGIRDSSESLSVRSSSDPSPITHHSSLLSPPASRVPRLDSGDSRVTSHESRTPSFAKSAADFISQLWPHAEAAGKELGVDPRTLLAHAALETGWGKKVPCNPDGTCSFNLFGVKAGARWRGDSVGANTREYTNGVAVRQRANFRAYASAADSFKDYAALLKNNPRFSAALGLGDDAVAFASVLQRGGYATDPNYAAKLAAVADRVAERIDASLKTAGAQPLAFERGVSRGGET